MSDPLAQVVGLLQPRAIMSKLVTAAGAWSAERSEDGRPVYAAVLGGSCRLALDDGEPITLQSGDFVLVPALYNVRTSSLEPPSDTDRPARLEPSPGVIRLGTAQQPNFRMLVGHFAFGSHDANLLLSLLPHLILVRGQRRLTTLVELADDEARDNLPGRDLVLSRLIEVVLIEALRSTAGPAAPPGLLRGLADSQLAAALRKFHAEPTYPWTVAKLAVEAGLSRSRFFERFKSEIGLAPMEYALSWRIAMAKDLLRRGTKGIAQVAEQVGYNSASTFSVAFARHVGMSPTRYLRQGPTTPGSAHSAIFNTEKKPETCPKDLFRAETD